MKDEEIERINPQSFFDDTMPLDGFYQSFGLIFALKKCVRALKSKRKTKKLKTRK